MALVAVVRRPEQMEKEAGISAAEAVLLERLRQYCPPGFDGLVDKPCEDWSLTIAEHGAEGGEWMLADAAVVARSTGREGLKAEAAKAAEGIQRELDFYYRELGGRFFGKRRGQLLQPTARAMLSRRLWRFAATSLRTGDLSDLEVWCEFLRGVVRSRLFDRSNWFRRSHFEQTVAACLVRLEGLRRLQQGEQGRQPSCNFAPRQLDEACAKREHFGRFRTPDLRHFKVYRQMASAEQVLSRVQVVLPTLPGLQNVAMLSRLLVGVVLGRACLGLGGHLLEEAKAVAAGDIDERTLAEDALVSMASAASFAAVRCASVAIGITNPMAAMAVDAVAPNVAALLTGFLIRSAGRRVCGTHRVRALRCAYLSLGLNPIGAGLYKASEIEAQLEWKLREQDQEPLQLWAAYSLIRMYQHCGLQDPHMSSPSSSSSGDAFRFADEDEEGSGAVAKPRCLLGDASGAWKAP